MLQLERTRNRIAMDLHDDIGSTLTRMSVMTEVAQRRLMDDRNATQEFLAKIGDTSRDLIESLGDIVWTVDPHHDDLQNVIRRIVQFGQEVCEGRNIAFETELAGTFDAVKLAPEQRRDIYLVFKEGINNLVKHSGATRARFGVRPVNKGILMELQDNGRGIAQGSQGTGHGLVSLQERGNRVGSRFVLEGSNGSGTRLCLEIKTG
jgi:signal transduction histidine kinase